MTIKHEHGTISGISISLSKSCRSPFLEGRNNKKGNCTTFDLSCENVTKVGFKVAVDQDISFHGIRFYSEKGLIIDQEFSQKMGEWEYQTVAKNEHMVGVHGYIWNQTKLME